LNEEGKGLGGLNASWARWDYLLQWMTLAEEKDDAIDIPS
jgi:hypothetical protein